MTTDTEKSSGPVDFFIEDFLLQQKIRIRLQGQENLLLTYERIVYYKKGGAKCRIIRSDLTVDM